jgi:hypothetical protein
MPCPRCHSSAMVRKFPLEAVRNIQIFEPFYHEALGVDITGKRHQKEVYRYFGIVEAGDRNGGARNEEKSSLVTKMVPVEPQGRTLADIQREREQGKEVADDFTFVTKKGAQRAGALPDIKAKKGNIDAVVSAGVTKGIEVSQINRET